MPLSFVLNQLAAIYYMTKILMDEMKDPESKPRLALVIFAARESLGILLSTLESAISASGDNTVIDVLVNGNQNLTTDLNCCRTARLNENGWNRIRIWSIKTADKANAWNQYFHKIWSGEEFAFFSDGYVRLLSDSIDLLKDGVSKNELALGGSGVPSIGRSAHHVAKRIVTGGGFHGNFCCLRGSTIAEVRRQKFRIPLGLYRTDSLVGAALYFGLDPKRNKWDAKRIYVHPQATWGTPSKNLWRYREWIALLKRRIRQAKGVLENAALRDHLLVRKQPLEAIPETATKLVTEWMTRCPGDAQAVIKRNPTTRLVLSSYNQAAEWIESDLLPTQVDLNNSEPA